MKAPTTEYWNCFQRKYPSNLIEGVRQRFAVGESFAVSAWEISEALNTRQEDTARLLETLEADGFLTSESVTRCMNCDDLVDEQELESGYEHSCGVWIDTGSVDRTKIYSRQGLRKRDPTWLITIHGMNTRGAWQEDFAWRLSKTYKYSIPTFIWKYGWILISPLVFAGQRKFLKKTIGMLKKRISEMESDDYGPRPDVIAHSFGTWLLGNALVSDASISVGRVVLTGSILPPTFDWSSLVRDGRVGAVMCHCGRKDKWVRLAPFFVRNSGPSGFRGFNDRNSIYHVYEAAFGHSDFFRDENIDSVMSDTWGEFLTSAVPPVSEASSSPDGEWRPPFGRFLGFLVKYLTMLLVLLGLIAAVVVHF